MLSTLLLSFVPTATVPPTPTAVAPLVQEDAAARIAACGEDVAKLHALAEELKEAKDRAGTRAAFERILELAPDDEAAHKGLRHHFYDGQWFTSYASLSKYRREEAKRMKEEHGLVRHNNEWVKEVDLPYIRMGWEQEEDGTWSSPVAKARAAQIAEYEAKGWKQRGDDSTWVAPENFDLWNDGLFKVEDEWFTKEEANEYHGEIGKWWEQIGEHFICRSTIDLDNTGWARWYADQTWDDLVAIYGTEPETKPIFAVFKELPQYNSFAAGDQAAQRQATESTGFSSLHHAFLADIWFDILGVNDGTPVVEYIGGGVALWDQNDENLFQWGQYAIRHAAALSFGEHVDRAWEIVSQFLSQGGGGGAPASIWDGKRLPAWFHYGAASYVERYRRDAAAEQNGGDPWAIRNWALGEIVAAGEPHSLEQIFQFPLDINDIDGSKRYIHEGGMVMSFVMDGGCAPVTAAHAALKEAFAAGGDTSEQVAALQQAILDNEGALRAFVGLGEKPAADAATEPVEAAAGESATTGDASE